MKQKKVLFLTLSTFSLTGGIEKFNRAFIKALGDLSQTVRLRSSAASMYDDAPDKQYIGQQLFSGSKGKRIQFVCSAFIKAMQQDVVILGHLNLALIGVLIKLFSPKKKLVVICHGIEVFTPVSGFKKKVLQKADRILAVSSYTKNQLIEQQQLQAEKISVFPNTIDPFFQLPADFAKPAYLQQRYGITEGERVLFTLTRLNSKEGYKGYDTLVTVLPKLVQQGIRFKYILAGKADAVELARMQALIKELQLEKYVALPGFVADDEVIDHYLLADVFAMPSKGEGFGIVYIEAMACGLAVVAGNKDGSTEALQFGKLGTLVDPDNADELAKALVHVLLQQAQPAKVQGEMLAFFSFERFKGRLADVLASV
ncbi:glycosyltransferase family 1 protein [Lacibacter luteus]|uniref:Glycosyltransferase family 1 protein n=1 Tax=Lacibacter luteus TaxID=2508719 RepID=A0A4Q1CD59_9BACT|nr:glycosyltransferase family 4 protein [Lacibacter luteus]RXK57443.1 glycosyltransferase family 1 protein [Lacibacter luteus]